MTTPLLRIVLAFHLAIWSPAMCCCGIKSVIGRISGSTVQSCAVVGVAAAMSEREGVDVDVVDDAAPRSCCAARLAAEGGAQASSQFAADANGASTSSKPAQQPHPCRCHQSKDAQMRLDTGAKVTLPALAKTGSPLPALLLAIVPSFTLARLVSVGCEHRSHAPPGQPRTTLLAQRCLLLI